MQRKFKMSVRPIRNETDDDNAFDRVDELMDLNPAMHTPPKVMRED